MQHFLKHINTSSTFFHISSLLKTQQYLRRSKLKPHIKLWTEDEIKQYKKEERNMENNKDSILKQDDEQFITLTKKFFRTQKQYQKIQNDWKDNLIMKHKKKERKLQRDNEREIKEQQDEKLVLHSSQIQNIILDDDLYYDSFAIINIKGIQYKIVEDDLLRIQKIDNYKIGDLIEIDKILLIGNKLFTMIGRPYVQNAKIYLRIEEQTKLRGLTVFKKKRRKGYQKTIGHYARYTALRVEKIQYEIPENIQKKAVRLIAD